MLTRPNYRRFRQPRPSTIVLGSSVLPKFTGSYQSERKSTTGNNEVVISHETQMETRSNTRLVIQILNPRPGPPPREEPILEPSNFTVQPPVVPPPNRPGRVTNQLQYIQEHVINQVWNHEFASIIIHHPVNAQNLPVSLNARKLGSSGTVAYI